MNKKKKALVAMSGGVDSSVTAALLKQKGFEVVGIYMSLFPEVSEKLSHQSANKSARAADSLGIDHFTVDLSERFKTKVIDYFVSEYTKGYTPNPCVRCNPYIKFSALWEESKKIGACCIATGHYARVEKDSESRKFYIKRSVDKKKDQSYFLYLLSQEYLSQTLLPLGDWKKEEVRKKAQDLRLPSANQKESQEICFIPEDDYVSLIRDRSSNNFDEGPILDREGNVLGKHSGYAQFTIGQRRGLGIAASHPLYVLDIIPEKNAVVVGPEKCLYKRILAASKTNWISGRPLKSPLPVLAQIRYKHTAQEAVVIPKDSGKVQVEFKRPQRAVTPGQSVVFYDGDVLLGGGTITRSFG